MLAVIIILHRLPGVISPKSFHRIVWWYTDTRLRMKLGAVFLILFSLWGIYAILDSYPAYGWLIIGLSIVLLHKALKFAALPDRAAVDERHAWDQPVRNVFFICLGSVAGGILFLLFILMKL